MYTNTGILVTMQPRDIARTYMQIQATLNAVEKGEAQIEKCDFEVMARWEEDIKAHFLHRAEVLGMTNVANASMDLP